MFTGIIENLGSVTYVKQTKTGLKLKIKFKNKISRLKLGESIAVDGVCLTATEVRLSGFTADVVQETLKATTLGHLRPGSDVHLERALRFGTRVGGHMIAGHVDGQGTVTRVFSEGESKILWVKIPVSIRDFCLPKGSIAINGVSLTLQEVSKEQVKIALVPHTLQATLLGTLTRTSLVNIEADLVSRYTSAVQKSETALMIRQRTAFLRRRGF